MTTHTLPESTTPPPMSWRTLLLMMGLAVFIGAVMGAMYVGMNGELGSLIKAIVENRPVTVADNELQETTNPDAVTRSGIGADVDPGGYILLELNEIEHFFYTNVEFNPVFAEIEAEVIAHGDEYRLIQDVNNLISFNNAEDEIQHPGSAFELLMRSLYTVVDHYNNTEEPHLPCAVIIANEASARDILIQIRIPPGPANQRVKHEEPYVNPREAGESVDIVCYFPPQS